MDSRSRRARQSASGPARCAATNASLTMHTERRRRACRDRRSPGRPRSADRASRSSRGSRSGSRPSALALSATGGAPATCDEGLAGVRVAERQRGGPGHVPHAGNGCRLPARRLVELQQQLGASDSSTPAGPRSWSARSRRGSRDRTVSTASSVRSSRPAPNRSSTAVATSPATSKLREGGRRAPVVVRLSDAMRLRAESAVACHAGAMPNSRPTTQCRGGAERDDPRVEGERPTAGGSRSCGNQRRGAAFRIDRAGRQRPGRPADERQQQAFGHELPDDAPPVRAERRPDRQLTRPHRGPRQQQVGDVGAADQQHEADDAEEEERRPAQLGADHGVVQRLERRRRGRAFVFGNSRASPAGDAGHVGVRLLERHAGLQASDRRAGSRRSARPAAGGRADTIAHMLVRPNSCASSGATPTTV